MEVAGAAQIGVNDDSLVGSGLACLLAGKKGRDGFVGERSDGKGPCMNDVIYDSRLKTITMAGS